MELILHSLTTVLVSLKNFILELDEKVGIRRSILWLTMIILFIGIINIRSVTKGVIEFVNAICEDIHNEKMHWQEVYMTELTPILSELRATVGADRILYFEYHNSEENLEGMPFKFFDLMKCIPRYGIPEIPGRYYQNVNTSMYTEFFSKLQDGEVLNCNGARDVDFRRKYRGIYELVSETDKSRKQSFISVPGVRRPLGFIVIEWTNDSTEKAIVYDENLIHNTFIPRITAISSAGKK